MSSIPASIWSPLRRHPFRGLWSCGAVYFIGNAMQTMAAAWLMVELTGSSFLAALVQTAVFLPMFLLALPAGVLADTTDRRTLIVRALVTQVGVSVVLAALVVSGAAGPGVLLFFIFVSGCCTALLSPAWNSTVADTVPRDELPLAITAVAMAFNAARALGPALAGVLFAQLGGGWVFLIAVACVLTMLQAIRRWPPAPHAASRLPAERLWGGTLAGLRFARHSQMILAQLVRTVAFGGAGSALWALLPVIGQRQLGLGAQGFGLLMACLGGGAVAAGFFIGRLRARLGLEKVVGGSCLVFAAVMAIAAFARWPWLVYVALLFGGAAWMATMSTFNTAHADQRAAVGALARDGDAHPVRAGFVRDRLGGVGLGVGARRPDRNAVRRGAVHGRGRAAAAALPAANGRGARGHAGHALGGLVRRRRAGPRGGAGGGGDRLPHPPGAGAGLPGGGDRAQGAAAAATARPSGACTATCPTRRITPSASS